MNAYVCYCCSMDDNSIIPAILDVKIQYTIVYFVFEILSKSILHRTEGFRLIMLLGE